MGQGPNQEVSGVPESKRDPRLAKAETWLAHQADHPDGVSDQEALIYLRSRGRDCHSQVSKLIASWKAAEEARLNDFIQRHHREPALLAHDIRVEDTSQFELPDFWEAPQLGEYSDEATMLRTVRWCDVPGFDPWWRRLAQRSQENLLRRGTEEPAQAAYWLFNMLRSDYATELMPNVLQGYLNLIGLASPRGRAPWITESLELHVAHASTIIFVHHRLTHGNPGLDLLRQASEAICKHQSESGAWPTFTSDQAPSIESTAMVLHALALARPRGWPRIAVTARDWLWSMQETNGSWTEAGTPGAAFLTVLVLDAITLANGEANVTFGKGTRPNAPALDSADDRRIAVQNYREEVLRKTGKQITMTDIWKKAGYSDRSEFERWIKNDPRATKAAHRNISRILTEKPHLK